MNDREYNEIEAIRRSTLWQIHKTPMHFKYYVEQPQERTEALVFGSAIHKYLLEPESFSDEYAIRPDGINLRTKVGKEVMAEFMQDNEGKDIITLEQFNQIVDMVKVLRTNDIISQMLEESKKEQAYVWTDEATGERCKVKADMIVKLGDYTHIVDYKTTQSCADGEFERSARKYGYKFQAGMYCEGIESELLEKCMFVFIAQEKAPPYAYRIYWCDPEFVNAGRKQFHDLLEEYHECKVHDDWPGYDAVDLLEEVY